YGWSQTAGNVQSIEDIATTLAMPVLPAPPESAPLPFEDRISFEQVSFGYGGSALALRDVNLVIPRGSRIGIAGTTGSGKSTLLDLLMGLLEPGAGAIRVDGRLLD